jgi:GNAT superfamily N-acetyltransferase
MPDDKQGSSALVLSLAGIDDVPDVVSLQVSANRALTAKHGPGPWSSGVTAKGVLFRMTGSRIYLARLRTRPVATLTLSTRKPWAIDTKYFTPVKRPLYLTAMAVAPEEQRHGIGRLCVEDARRIAREWPADAMRLDAYDAVAGAGGFYAKCGFRDCGRAAYRHSPLIYFESLL